MAFSPQLKARSQKLTANCYLLTMAWFKREPTEIQTPEEKRVRTEGLWVKCDDCRQIIWKKELEENRNVCPKCDYHFRIDAPTRLALLLDENSYQIKDEKLASTD